MKVGLVIHDGRPEVIEFARKFVDVSETFGLSVVADERIVELVDPDGLMVGVPDVVVAVGGDGTMLAAAQVAMEHDAPLFGFNLSRSISSARWRRCYRGPLRLCRGWA